MGSSFADIHFKKNGKVLIDDEVFENIANIYEKEGSDCWFSDNPQKFLGKKYDSKDYEKLKDIVEVWFDSGSTHSFVLEKEQILSGQHPCILRALINIEDGFILLC